MVAIKDLLFNSTKKKSLIYPARITRVCTNSTGITWISDLTSMKLGFQRKLVSTRIRRFYNMIFFLWKVISGEFRSRIYMEMMANTAGGS